MALKIGMVDEKYVLLGTKEIGVRYRFPETNCGAVRSCHIPFCSKVKGMTSFE